MESIFKELPTLLIHDIAVELKLASNSTTKYFLLMQTY